MGSQTVSFRIDATKVLKLDRLAAAQQRDRTSILNEAIDRYLETHQDQSTVPVKGFGLWRDLPEDGLTYQERLRAEWNPH